MVIRTYKPADCLETAALFYQTVHTVNAKDYSARQRDAWAEKHRDLAGWNRSFLHHLSLVAVEKGKIIGFGDIHKDGYLDRLYVHREYQRRGVAAKLCDRLEKSVSAPVITVHASVTALPFFLKRGYRIRKRQAVFRNGVFLINYQMEKRRLHIFSSGA